MTTYINDADLGFIPLDEWENKNGKRQLIRNKGSHQIMKDIEPFISPIDQTLITSRPQLRDHNKKHGVTNIADYSPDHFVKGGEKLARQARGQTAKDKQDRCEALDKTLTDLGA